MTDSLIIHDVDVEVIDVECACEVLTAVEQGPPGPPGPIGPSGGSALSVMAGVALGGHRIVYLDAVELAQYADAADIAHASVVLGMTLNAAAALDPIDVMRLGEVEEPSWNWTLNEPVFLGSNGVPTQVVPDISVAAFSLIIGFPITPTKLFISLREPLTLS